MKTKQLVVSLLCLVAFASCAHWTESPGQDNAIEVVRFDSILATFLSDTSSASSSLSAWDTLCADYPFETRALANDVIMLPLDSIDGKDVRTFFTDTTLMAIFADTRAAFIDFSDVEDELGKAFHCISNECHDFTIPVVSTQIQALGASITVEEGHVGIGLDKYLGEDYAYYATYFAPEQRRSMNRRNMVPDAIYFYLSLYCPPAQQTIASHLFHTAKLLWVVAHATGRSFASILDIEEDLAKEWGKTHGDSLQIWMMDEGSQQQDSTQTALYRSQVAEAFGKEKDVERYVLYTCVEDIDARLHALHACSSDRALALPPFFSIP